MRKLVIFLLVYGFAISVGNAAPAYGTKMPAQGKIFGGLQSYSVLNRSLAKNYGKVRSQQQFVLLSYGVFDWLSLDLKGGAGDLRHHGGTESDTKYQPYLSGGYGVRVRLYEYYANKVVVGFQHISVHPSTVAVNGVKNKVVLDDWQFSLLASHEFKWLTPYAGTRWSRMNEIHWMDTVRKLEKSIIGRSVGVIVGADIPINDRIWFNVEGQFVDATAVAGSINFSF